VYDPQSLNFPDWFTEFRPAQSEAISFAVESDKRFTAIGAPPGVGKTGIAWALCNLLPGTKVVLTATLGLEDQATTEYGPVGLVDMRGRSNFPCWEGGTCEDGLRLNCSNKGEDCPYTQQFIEWCNSETRITNYAWWLAVMSKPGPKKFIPDVLILDEAGLADEWLARSLNFRITEKELREIGVKLQYKGEDCGMWAAASEWLQDQANIHLIGVRTKITQMEKGRRAQLAGDLRKAESIADRVARLAGIEDTNWIVELEEGNNEGRVWKFECVWPGQYRERLFQNIPRVVLLSATLRPKTLNLLGIKSTDRKFREWPRQFPIKNGPVIWIPTTRVTSKMTPENRDKWLDRIVEICRARSDRRGIIHSVSYARAKEITERLRREGFWVQMNGANDPETASARDAFERFKAGPPNAILCSPSFGTGWDFKGKLAEYQIIAKIPLKDMRSRVMKARRERDSGYEDYMAAQDLVQACGRPVRSDDDRGETLIVDDTLAGWWFRKAEEHFPRWWKYRREDQVPKALPLLPGEVPKYIPQDEDDDIPF